MSFTKEQKRELNRLDDQYARINKLSGNAGMNPDKLISEFSFKFMDVSELNRQLFDKWNEGRNKTFQNENPKSCKSDLD